MVGDYDDMPPADTGVFPKTLTEHWDGTQWNVVASPNAPEGVQGSFLRGVSAVSSNDVWAVGYYHTASLFPLIEHWDGTQWTIVPGPTVGPTNAVLHDVKAISSNDVWAIGFASLGSSANSQAPIAFHWNGTQWTNVSVPAVGPNLNTFTGISALSSTDIWAVGWYYDSNGIGNPLTMHWDGMQWGNVPNPGTAGDALYSVAAIAPNDVWAVGESGTHALVMHWDGSTWSIVSAPDSPASSQTLLWSVAAVSNTDVWLVGAVVPTLAEHFTSPCMAPTRVVSRIVHGNAGTFDVDLTSGNGIECRSTGTNGDYTVVFTFADPLTNVASANVSSGVGSVLSGNIDTSDAHNYIVNLTGVANAQRVTINLNNLTDSAGGSSNTISTQMGVLIGDVNSSGRVDAADVSSVRQQTLQSVDLSNFRNDLNASGRIDAADVSIARQQTLTSLP
jgi:hypothetical protein